MKKEALELEYPEKKINNKIVEELLKNADPSKLFGKDGLFSQLKKQLIERVLESELEHEVGYSKHSRENKESSNRRGSYEKTIIDGEGHKMTIEVPRDREG